MTATLEQTQSELRKLVQLAQQGEEVLITSQGRPIAKLTGLPQPKTPSDRKVWLARLAGLRARIDSGKQGLTVEQILEEDRGAEGFPLVNEAGETIARV
jgi:antitoxin (DNA-binding transcriptional repressor) of toxin-antitoxin stability system